jgi:nicotinamidase-related amidase
MTSANHDLRIQTEGFAGYLEQWQESLEPETLEAILMQADGPEHVGIFCVDMLNGFCHEGKLQSDRVKDIIEPVCSLLTHAWRSGVRHFVLTQDNHNEDAQEFNEFPSHCIAGSWESETIPEIMSLPFSSHFTIFPKRSISSSILTGLDDWLDAHPQITHRIVVGDCTDLCVYQLAMHLKLRANAQNLPHPVIIPSDCVETYDLPEDIARDLGVPAHPADLFHSIFLYHMALNGILVRRVII